MYTLIIINYFYFFLYCMNRNSMNRMNRNSINFDNKNIKKSEFYNKDIKIFNIDDIDVNNILVSKKEQYSKHNPFKYFIWYNDNGAIRPLYLFISQTTGYINKSE